MTIVWNCTTGYYRNKYWEGGDCLDIEDQGWVV